MPKSSQRTAFNYQIASNPTVQIFTSSGTWIKPACVTIVRVCAWGAGGGGGGGAKGTANIWGGAGGGGGGRVSATFAASQLPSRVTVTIGAGAAGGTGSSSNNSTGGYSCQGGVTTFGAPGTTFSALSTLIVRAPGGYGGFPGGAIGSYAIGAAGGGLGNNDKFTGSAGTCGLAQSIGLYGGPRSSQRFSSSPAEWGGGGGGWGNWQASDGQLYITTGGASMFGPGGGGGGGTANTTHAGSGGGGGGMGYLPIAPYSTANTAVGTTAQAGSRMPSGSGSGGAGGAGAISGNGMNGAPGGPFGGGGGGGSSIPNGVGTKAGDGGTGGPGGLVVYSW